MAPTTRAMNTALLRRSTVDTFVLAYPPIHKDKPLSPPNFCSGRNPDEGNYLSNDNGFQELTRLDLSSRTLGTSFQHFSLHLKVHC